MRRPSLAARFAPVVLPVLASACKQELDDVGMYRGGVWEGVVSSDALPGPLPLVDKDGKKLDVDLAVYVQIDPSLWEEDTELSEQNDHVVIVLEEGAIIKRSWDLKPKEGFDLTDVAVNAHVSSANYPDLEREGARSLDLKADEAAVTACTVSRDGDSGNDRVQYDFPGAQGDLEFVMDESLGVITMDGHVSVLGQNFDFRGVELFSVPDELGLPFDVSKGASCN